jgi:AsmA protein
MKMLIKLLSGLLMLLVVAALALPLVIDPNDFKQQITRQVEQHTGRTLTIGGDIRLSYYPWLGIELQQLSLGNAPGFGQKPFVQVQQAKVRVKLLPLLKKHLEMDTLIIKGLQARLIKRKDGRNNWQDLLNRGGATDSEGPSPVAALMIGGMDMSDAQLLLDDRAAGHGVRITDLQLRSGRYEPGKPVDMQLNAMLQPLPKASQTYRAALRTRLDFDPDQQRLTLADLDLSLAEAKGPQRLDLSGRLEMNTALQLVNGKDLVLKGKLRLPATGKLLDIDLTTQLAANINQRHLSLSPLAIGLTPGSGPALSLRASLNADLRKGLAIIDDLRADYGKLQLKGQMRLNNLQATPSLSARLSTTPFNPRTLANSLGLKIPRSNDPVAFSKGALSFALNGSARQLKLTDLKLKLDDSLLSGTAALHLRDKPDLRFNLSLNRIDLQRYLPATQPRAKPGKAAAKANAAGQKNPLPRALAALFAIDMQGSLGVGTLKLDGFQAGNLSLNVKQADRKLSLRHTLGSLYQGDYTGVLHLNGSGKVPSVKYQATLKQVQLKPLLVAALQEKRLQGRANLQINLSTLGNSLPVMKKRLRGKLSLTGDNLKADATRLSGNASLTLGKKRPQLAFDIKADQLNLNRYMAPASGPGGNGTGAQGKPGGGNRDKLPLKAWFALNMKGNLTLQSLQLRQLQASNLNLTINQVNGKLTLKQAIGNFYQGKYQGVAVLHAGGKGKGKGKLPTLNFQASVKGVQAAPLLKALSGEDRLRGKGDCSLKLRSQGHSLAALRQAMQGQLQLSLRNGAIKGFNLGQTLRDAKANIARLQGKAAQPAGKATLETDFSELKASARIRGRLIDNTALNVKSPYLRFEGKGQLDTGRQWLDYRLTTRVVNSHRGQGGKDFRDLENIPIPMSYKGPLTQMKNWRKWTIHLDKVLQAKLQQAAEQEAKALLQKKLGLPAGADGQKSLQGQLEDKARDEALDALKKLF